MIFTESLIVPKILLLDQKIENIHVPKNKSKPPMHKEAMRKLKIIVHIMEIATLITKNAAISEVEMKKIKQIVKKNNFSLRELDSKIQTLNLIACIENVQHKAFLAHGQHIVIYKTKLQRHIT
ncbi:hypothetical protein DMUE_3147 [Dictyocoela muelleri]|nr:hypothetical protein DMUE_3147 [Dictyocoela muelleri]